MTGGMFVEFGRKLEAGEFWRRVLSRKQQDRWTDEAVLECGHRAYKNRMLRALGDSLLCWDCCEEWLKSRRENEK
jgi:hypothetical protein